MLNSLKNFPKQFFYQPTIENKKLLKKRGEFIVCGMGGSGLASKLFKVWQPSFPIYTHQNYGLPEISPAKLKKSLIILSSYSGNTEETLDAFALARKKKLATLAITAGGQLLELAKKYKIPYIQIPNTGTQPRVATGFSFLALLKATRQEKTLKNIAKLSRVLDSKKLEACGQNLAEKLKNKVPIIYASEKNGPIAQNWKIKFNETAKIPAFYNILPELNHNEMTGFDMAPSTKNLSEKFVAIILKDKNDHPRIIRRMEVLKQILEKHGLPVELITMQGLNPLHKIFSTLLIADWTAYTLANFYGIDHTNVPMVEEFKKLIN